MTPSRMPSRARLTLPSIVLLSLVVAPDVDARGLGQIEAARWGEVRASSAVPRPETQADTIRYTVRVTNGNLMGVTVSNYGFFGNNFVSRSPSMEYPLGAAYEHMVRGGLWFGARALDDSGSFTGVVTAAVDGAEGNSSQLATEFTPAGLEIVERSTLPNNRFFSPLAVSEQDYISVYNDHAVKRSSNNREDHRPMKISVRQENYGWSFSDYQHFVVFHFVITNQGPPLANAWVGFYSELASGDKGGYGTWPPGGSWYNKKWIQYDDSLRLVREHYCATVPIPDGCQFETAPDWVGIKLLTPPDTTIGQKVTLGAWNWEPGATVRDEDTERYAALSAGTLQPLDVPEFLPPVGDPVEILALGPFAQIDPGDSIVVDFAMLGGATIPDLHDHCRFAQRAYDRDYIVPIPPPSPRLHVDARDGALDLYWDDSPERVTDPTSPIPQDFEGYRVYAGEDRLDLHRIAQFDKNVPPGDTTGFNTGLSAIELPQPVVIDGISYKYRFTVPAVRNGFKYFVAVTSYDLGNVEIEPLESGVAQNKTLAIPGPAPGERPSGQVTVFPNPYRVEARWDQGSNVRDHYLWFANLPSRCTLKIFTLSGDLVFETDFDGAQYHGGGSRGIYDPARELDVPPPTLSGTTFGWNLISRQGQAVATGLYMYAVEDRDTGDRTLGKFLIVKSDREELRR